MALINKTKLLQFAKKAANTYVAGKKAQATAVKKTAPKKDAPKVQPPKEIKKDFYEVLGIKIPKKTAHIGGGILVFVVVLAGVANANKGTKK